MGDNNQTDTQKIARASAPRAETLTLGITTVAAIAFTAGAWQFNRLVSSVDAFGARMEAIVVRLSLVEEAARVGQYEVRMRDLERRMATVEAQRNGGQR